MPPKATKRPTKMAVVEDPGEPSGFLIPMDRKLNFSLSMMFFQGDDCLRRKIFPTGSFNVIYFLLEYGKVPLPHGE